MTSRSGAGGGSVRRAARGEYIETDSGNKVSRRAQITGAGSIQLIGKTVIQAGVVLRGDLNRSVTNQRNERSSSGAATTTSSSKSEAKSGSASATSTSINIGKYTIISQGCVIKPPGRMSRGVMTYYPLRIGDNVFIGPNAHISSAQIASNVHVGAHAILHPFSIIKDHVKILPHSVVPAGMVVASGSVVGGRPARVVAELPDGWGVKAGDGGGDGSGGGASGWVEGGDLMDLVRSIR